MSVVISSRPLVNSSTALVIPGIEGVHKISQRIRFAGPRLRGGRNSRSRDLLPLLPHCGAIHRHRKTATASANKAVSSSSDLHAAVIDDALKYAIGAKVLVEITAKRYIVQNIRKTAYFYDYDGTVRPIEAGLSGRVCDASVFCPVDGAEVLEHPLR